MSSIKRIYLYGYKRASQSLKLLQKKLVANGYNAVRRSPQSIYKPHRSDLVITWGTSSVPHWRPRWYVNTPDKVLTAGNKLKTFQSLKENNVAIPDFTTEIEEAKTWLPDSWVVCRKLLRSSGGKGIVLAKTAQELVVAPLYVKYFKKQKEFRVHVWKGTIIDVVEKRKRHINNRPDNFDTYIRNHTNGWVFCHNDVVEPVGLRDLAVSACAALKLDFGAVDIVYNAKTDKCVVLEINTAPGIEGTTLDKYVEAMVA